MATDLLITTATLLGTDPSAEPPASALAKGYAIIEPLSLAGTCLIEQLTEPQVSPGGTRMIVLDEPLHLDLFNPVSTQLAWVVARMDYIAEKIGIKWAAFKSRLLSGQSKVYFDLPRS
jgi:hypothetical protein